MRRLPHANIETIAVKEGAASSSRQGYLLKTHLASWKITVQMDTVSYKMGGEGIMER